MIYHTGFHPLVFFTGNRDHDKSTVTAFYFTKILQKVCEGNYWDDDRNDAEPWIQCPVCSMWLNETCAGVYGRHFHDFICEDWAG